MVKINVTSLGSGAPSINHFIESVHRGLNSKVVRFRLASFTWYSFDFDRRTTKAEFQVVSITERNSQILCFSNQSLSVYFTFLKIISI